MSNIRVQAASVDTGAHLVLYDGVCGLCRRLLQFLLVRDRAGAFHYSSLQSPAGEAAVRRFGGNPHDLTSFYVIANYERPDARLLSKARAALFVGHAIGSPWKLTGLLGVLPTIFLDGIYDVIARNRYRIFGRRETCLVPRPEHRDRFVDLRAAARSGLDGAK
jgi:predicted DCC family thiol-disulfide oxidoreductase YuxK